MEVCVLGAGIVGLATAYELSRQGARVTVVDASTPGSGASGGNGAQLSYSYVQPLADPSIWKQLPKLLLEADSPLKFRPQWDVQQWRWCLAFMSACNAKRSAQTTAELLALASLSRAGFEQALAAEHLDCDYSSTGKLVLYPTAQTFLAAQRQVELQSQLGSQQTALTPREACDVEPALMDYQAQIAGAVYTPSECAVDCLKLCIELERVLRARGVQFVLNTPVTAFTMEGRRIVAAQTQAGALHAQHYVMALGSGSAALARSLGVYLPIYPLKGYSITLDIGASPAGGGAPLVNVTDIARKVVFARIGSRLRVAGMAELVGYDTRIEPKAITNLQRATQTIFPALAQGADQRPWAGLRPATPTGLPIVGIQPAGPSNLMMNAGHGALGLTLAFGTAELVARQLLHTGAPPFHSKGVATV